MIQKKVFISKGVKKTKHPNDTVEDAKNDTVEDDTVEDAKKVQMWVFLNSMFLALFVLVCIWRDMLESASIKWKTAQGKWVRAFKNIKMKQREGWVELH